ncbi:hypothetical protein ACSFA8_22660 [Variovorax sp. RT4R15]|uniref:hypothetical protein n=1 Tax=Variovorax sp. RT4R15 TaxID=3443737 RepID=UPI003F45471C
MKPPRSVLPGELTLDVRPANAAGSGLEESSREKTPAMVSGRSLDAARKSDFLLLSQPPELREQRDTAKEEVALRVSVIDGGDRMVYTDLRDRKGWAQPLAMNQALRDASPRHDIHETVSGSQARVVRTLERFESGAKGESRAMPATPYQTGKANARSRDSIASVQLETRISKNLPHTNVPSASRRSR